MQLRPAIELGLLFGALTACGPDEPAKSPEYELPPRASSAPVTTPSAPPGSEPFDAGRFAESCPTLESSAPIRAVAALDEDPSWLRQDPDTALLRVKDRLQSFVKSCPAGKVEADPEKKLILVQLAEPCGPNRAEGRVELRFLPTVARGFLTLHIDLALGETRFLGDLVLDAAREPKTLCLQGTIAFDSVKAADAALDSVPPPGKTSRIADALEFQRSLVWPLFPWLIFPTKHEKQLQR